MTVRSPKLTFGDLHATQKKTLFELRKQAEYELKDDITEVSFCKFFSRLLIPFSLKNIDQVQKLKVIS